MENIGTRRAERALNDIDDTRLFDIDLDESDLESARATTLSPSQTSALRPYRSPWLFRTELKPHFELPKMPVSAHLCSKTEHVANQQKQCSRCLSGHVVCASQCRCTEAKAASSPAQDSFASSQAWASWPLSSVHVEEVSVRCPAYHRGLVSIRRDFSKAKEERGAQDPA